MDKSNYQGRFNAIITDVWGFVFQYEGNKTIFDQSQKLVVYMNISLELSLYPLKESYGPDILDFIDRLKSHPNIEVQTNKMSTQIFGAYNKVMEITTKEMKSVFEQDDTVVMVMKVVNMVV